MGTQRAAIRLRRFAGNPMLTPNPARAWEALVTTNPGAWYDEASGQVVGVATCALAELLTYLADNPVRQGAP